MREGKVAPTPQAKKGRATHPATPGGGTCIARTSMGWAPTGTGILLRTFLHSSTPRPRGTRGQVTGVAIDSRDHVFIVHRPGSLDANETAASTNPPGAECCIAAPPVLEFDAAGNVVNGWGGPGVGFEWPDSEHGLYVDYRDHVWLTGNPHLALKFSHDGKFLLQIGTKGKTNGSNDPTLLGNATDLAVDPKTNEVFVSDGYANNRVVVFDADTGTYKRHWGAYGDRTPPDGRTKYDPKGPPARQFVVPHGIAMSTDGMVYVSDRLNDRIQAFTREGKFVKEGVVAPQTLINGS